MPIRIGPHSARCCTNSNKRQPFLSVVYSLNEGDKASEKRIQHISRTYNTEKPSQLTGFVGTQHQWMVRGLFLVVLGLVDNHVVLSKMHPVLSVLQ